MKYELDSDGRIWMTEKLSPTSQKRTAISFTEAKQAHAELGLIVDTLRARYESDYLGAIPPGPEVP